MPLAVSANKRDETRDIAITMGPLSAMPDRGRRT